MAGTTAQYLPVASRPKLSDLRSFRAGQCRPVLAVTDDVTLGCLGTLTLLWASSALQCLKVCCKYTCERSRMQTAARKLFPTSLLSTSTGEPQSTPNWQHVVRYLMMLPALGPLFVPPGLIAMSRQPA